MNRFSLYEPVEFIKLFLADKLDFRKVKEKVAIHVPCSSKKMGVSEAFTQLAAMCAEEVVPSGVPCCGAFFTANECSSFLLYLLPIRIAAWAERYISAVTWLWTIAAWQCGLRA